MNDDGHPDLFLGGGSRSGRSSRELAARERRHGLLRDRRRPSLEHHPRLRVEARPCPLGISAASAARLPPGYGYASDAEFGDVDGDGDLDLLVINVQDFDHLGGDPGPRHALSQ